MSQHAGAAVEIATTSVAIALTSVLFSSVDESSRQNLMHLPHVLLQLALRRLGAGRVALAFLARLRGR